MRSAPEDASIAVDSSRNDGRDAAIDGTVSDSDSDGDGIPDAVDNCPNVANPDQANEDGDAFGDACDLCPPFADQGQDTDHDGVGDLCDPFPTVPGDKIAAFWSFHNGLPPGAVMVGGTITTANGDATVVVTGTGTLTIPSTAAGDREDVWAEATLDDDPGGAIVGVVAEDQPNADSGIACQLVNGASPVLRIFDSDVGTSLISSAHPFDVGTRYQLHLRRKQTSYTCNTTSPVLQIAGDSTFAPITPQVGLRVRNATARYHWVMMTTSP